MQRVICIGTATIDTVYAVDRLPLAPGKNPSRSVKQVCGGLAANAAATVSSLGGQGVIWSRVGDDLAGAQIVRELAEWQVETEAVERVPGRDTVIATVLVDPSGERQIVYHMDARLLEQAAAPLDEVAKANAMMADTWWPDAAVPALTEARARGIPSVLDVETIAHSTDMALLELASHVALAQEALGTMAGTSDLTEGLRQLSERTNAWLAVTCGGDGVYWRDGDRLRHQPAFPVKVVDTLGAGDVFHGALALALAEQQPIEQAVRFGAAAAAVKCTRFGGRDGIPNRAEVEKLMASGNTPP
ncbi:MAG: PfkB family carbohydrate kinase [Pseudomonadota bacterium]